MNPLDMNPVEMINNANNYPQEKLDPLLGQYIAWSLDAKEILAHAWTLEEVYAEMDRLGRRDFVADFLPAAWDITGRPVEADGKPTAASRNGTGSAAVPEAKSES